VYSAKKVNSFSIKYYRNCYAPGWRILENGNEMHNDFENHGKSCDTGGWYHRVISYDMLAKSPAESNVGPSPSSVFTYAFKISEASAMQLHEFRINGDTPPSDKITVHVAADLKECSILNCIPLFHDSDYATYSEWSTGKAKAGSLMFTVTSDTRAARFSLTYAKAKYSTYPEWTVTESGGGVQKDFTLTDSVGETKHRAN